MPEESELTVGHLGVVHLETQGKKKDLVSKNNLVTKAGRVVPCVDIGRWHIEHCVPPAVDPIHTLPVLLPLPCLPA